MDPKQHAKEYGSVYAILVLLLGGGGVATLTDNLPVTHAEFREWTQQHNSSPHTQAAEAIDAITGQLKTIRIEQLRARLREAYRDKCQAHGTAANRYIDREISRLLAEWRKLTDENYSPPPSCP